MEKYTKLHNARCACQTSCAQMSKPQDVLTALTLTLTLPTTQSHDASFYNLVDDSTSNTGQLQVKIA